MTWWAMKEEGDMVDYDVTLLPHDPPRHPPVLCSICVHVEG